MFIPNPDFFHPGSNSKKEEGEKLNFYLLLDRYRKQFEPIDKKFKNFLPKNCQ